MREDPSSDVMEVEPSPEQHNFDHHTYHMYYGESLSWFILAFLQRISEVIFHSTKSHKRKRDGVLNFTTYCLVMYNFFSVRAP